jgi:Domain of unknown function (DUF4398)
MNVSWQRLTDQRLCLAAGLAGALLAAACASTPPPTASLQAARSAISHAEEADAGRYAAPELSDARERLAAANSAVDQKNMPVAQRLAEESRVDAQLAFSKAERAKAVAVNDEMRHSNSTLIDEMQRKSGDQQ